MFNNKTTKNIILKDGTEIALSLTIKSNIDYSTFDELKTVLQSIKKLYDDVVGETLNSSSEKAVKDLLGITE